MSAAREVMEALRVPRREKIVSIGRDEIERSTVMILACGHLFVVHDGDDETSRRFVRFSKAYIGMVLDCRECCA